MKRYLILIALFWACWGCAHISIQPMAEVGIDPTLTWDAATTDCTGAALSGTPTYNVYIIPGPGPMPTIQTANEVPCGSVTLIDISLVSRVNASPITVLTYGTTLAEGTYTAAVETVTSTGTRGGFDSLTFSVTLRGRAGGNVKVTK